MPEGRMQRDRHVLIDRLDFNPSQRTISLEDGGRQDWVMPNVGPAKLDRAVGAWARELASGLHNHVDVGA